MLEFANENVKFEWRVKNWQTQKKIYNLPFASRWRSLLRMFVFLVWPKASIVLVKRIHHLMWEGKSFTMASQKITIFLLKSIVKFRLNKMITNVPFSRKEFETYEHSSCLFWNNAQMHKQVSSLWADWQNYFLPLIARRFFCLNVNVNVFRLL